jgi:pimeloyl-ACP methyl ester carboxylesterase
VTNAEQGGERIGQLVYDGFGYAYRIRECASPTVDPIVVLCGVYQDVHSYRRFDRYWSDAGTVVSVDLPGSHATDPVPPEYGYELQAAALAQLIETLDLPRVNLVGVSWGYAAAHRYAQANPSRISHLVLTGAALAWPPDVRPRMIEGLGLLDANRVHDFATMALDVILCLDPVRPVRNREAIYRAMSMKLNAITPAEVPAYVGVTRRTIYCQPTLPGGIQGVRALCLTGEHDTMAPPEGTRAVAAEIDGAIATTIRESDHLAFQERAAEWTETLLRFFSDRPLDGLDYLTALEHAGSATGTGAPARPSAVAGGDPDGTGHPR